MNKKQSNKLNTYKSVKGVLKRNRRIYDSIPIMEETVDEFFALVQEIDLVAARTEMDTTGETSAKRSAKKNLAKLVNSLAAAGMVFAVDRSNIELESALNYAYYEIMSARDMDTLHIAGVIQIELMNHRDALASYMITQEDLENLESHIVAFQKAMEDKGSVKSHRVAYTQRLKQLFKRTDELLKSKLDRLMIRIREEYTQFYDAYRDARKIVDH